MKPSPRRLFAFVAAAVLAVGAALAGRAHADSALLTRTGVLYEVYRAEYGDVIAGASGNEARYPVLAFRTTRPGQSPVVALVDGTVSPEDKGSPSIGYDEITDTLFVVYLRFQGLMTDLHFAAFRGGLWMERSIIPSAGLYLSINPQLVVTRQVYVDLKPNGDPVSKARAIVSIVWWEEGGRSQARYAPVFVEDGKLRLDEITAYNLNELSGASGPTHIGSLPFSSYQFPSVQRDPLSNGGVLTSFANLAADRQSVLKIGFPDDMRDIIASGVPAGPQAYVRIHTPVGRGGKDGRIPSEVDTHGSVGTVIAPNALTPTFYWEAGGAMNVLHGDSPDGAPPTTVPLRSDMTSDRVVGVVREFVLGN